MALRRRLDPRDRGHGRVAARDLVVEPVADHGERSGTVGRAAVSGDTVGRGTTAGRDADHRGRLVRFTAVARDDAG